MSWIFKANILLTVPLFIEGQREMSVACDDGSFSSPKSSQEGVAFPFGRRTRFQTKCGAEILRATLVTPPPCGHPLYKQRESNYAIASDEMRFSLKSLATSLFGAASGRNTILWLLIIAEGEKSSALITSLG